MTPKRKFDPRTATALLMLAALSILPAAAARSQEDHRPPDQQPGQNPPAPPDSPDTPDMQETDANPPEQAEATTGDAEILAQLRTIDETEVRAAAAAQQKNVTGPVLRFAKMMEQDHGRDIEDVQRLTESLGLTLSDTTSVDQLRAHGEETMTRLAPLTGDDFGRAYIAAMVNGHREALQLIDDSLKTVQSEDVQQHLTSVREKVAHHLKDAEKLQGSIGQTHKPASSDARDDQPLLS
jgi:predicted outer membrane protein